MDKRPVIAISCGDPAGVGSEISLKALAHKEIYSVCRPFLIGDGCAFQPPYPSGLSVRAVKSTEDMRFEYGTVDLLDMKCLQAAPDLGVLSARCGDASFQYVVKAIELAMDKKADATVTAPISKEAVNLAGHAFSGHTEIYAHYTHTKEYAMMLAYEHFRVIHVSTHVSLREACDRVKKDRILSVIRLADGACRQLGIASPRIAVAGLNPHAGENGLFGNEEIAEIIPAVEQAKKMGILAEGPIPPDSVFPKLNGKLYDICVCMYHDQGHIPTKLLGFRWNEAEQKWNSVSGVNITLGLPIVRVSVDHGTAFDIAGKGIASDASMVNAILYAARLAHKSEKETE